MKNAKNTYFYGKIRTCACVYGKIFVPLQAEIEKLENLERLECLESLENF